MARINLDDALYDHGGFKALSSHKGIIIAQGLMAEAYKVAQFYWCREGATRSPVPLKIFLAEPLMQLLLDFDLATVDGDKVTVWDSENQFSWLLNARENGKKGGRPAKNNPVVIDGIAFGSPQKPNPIPDQTQIEPKSNPLYSLLSPLSIHTQPDVQSEVISHDKIIDLFNKICGGEGRIKTFNGHFLPPDAATNLFNRQVSPFWRNPENWEQLFREVVESNYLSGRKEAGFVATLPWILKPDKFEDIYGGLYGNRDESEKAAKVNSGKLGIEADQLFETIIREGRYNFSRDKYNTVQLKALELLGGIGVIFDCTNFTMDKVKGQLRTAYKTANEEA